MSDEIQKRKRINICLWAYAYEIKDDPIVSDAMFDKVSMEIDTDIQTDNHVMDFWFQHNFTPHTGQWIHKHPDLKSIDKLYRRLKNEQY